MPRLALGRIVKLYIKFVCTFIFVWVFIVAIRPHNTARETLQIQTFVRSTSVIGPPVTYSPHQPLKVVILGYQRCGSSLTGYLFNKNPDAFFMFEPLDGTYRHLYATAEGWNIPSDIFHYSNGSSRTIPRREVEAIVDTVDGVLNCRTHLIPTEVLTHRFLPSWLPRQQVLRNFTNCLSHDAAWTKYCNLKHICPYRFGKDMRKTDVCYKILSGIRRETEPCLSSNCTQTVSRLVKKYSNELKLISTRGPQRKKTIPDFLDYNNCILNASNRMNRCKPKFTDACQSASIRSVKTVRMTMASAEIILQRDNTVKFIHLLRDPRAVAWSRLKQKSFRGLYSESDPVKEAGLYCDQALQDVRFIHKLKPIYTNTFHTLIYDRFSKNLTFGAKEVYDFLNIELPPELFLWINNNSRPAELYPSWTENMNYQISKKIFYRCKELNEALHFPWTL